MILSAKVRFFKELKEPEKLKELKEAKMLKVFFIKISKMLAG